VQLLDVAIKKQEDTCKYYNELKIAIANELLKIFYHDKQNTYFLRKIVVFYQAGKRLETSQSNRNRLSKKGNLKQYYFDDD
jgi:hypothetical protein